MESPQNLKKRLKSVHNINQITKAMELVSATKMRKSQQIALDSRPYAFAALDLLATVSHLDRKLPVLFEARKAKSVLFILVASDKGLAGAFNSSVFKKFEAHIAQEKYIGEEKFFVAVGEKSCAYLSKRGFNVVKKITNAGDYASPEQVKPLAGFVIKGFLDKTWDVVVIISTHFRSALKQESHVRKVLPIEFEHITDTIKEMIPDRGRFADMIKTHQINFGSGGKGLKEYTIEPNTEKVLEKLAEHLLFMQVYHLILEANASEHSARRMAMKTASDNAKDLGDALNLEYNKSRQSLVTTQITEISAGAEALS